jgi:ATP-dependent RNA helicase RhlE
LDRAGIHAEAIHGNKSQNARQRALSNFKTGETRVLVATDIAARGIDVDEITHVINYELPNEPETYVHRIGRTARAGASGIALSFCEVEERPYLKDIQKLINQTIPVVDEHPYVSDVTVVPDAKPAARSSKPPQSSRSSNNQGQRRFSREGQSDSNRNQGSNESRERRNSSGSSQTRWRKSGT